MSESGLRNTPVYVTALLAVMFTQALMGLGFGMTATIRPVDALAFALPAGVWLLWRALRDYCVSGNEYAGNEHP